MNREMFEKVKEANKLSYAPYSNYHVSAAILMKNGDIVTGCNIENCSYGLSMCAERTALFKAISMGYKSKDMVSIMIYTDRTDSMPYPCGACRQVMGELLGLEKDVIIVNDNEKEEVYKLKELIPFCFTKESL